ncbi:MAG: RtcB family protein [Firmicutes bacterium]|nr:RtcB family protein [Bacillota bacterium]
MINIQGKYSQAIIYTDVIEESSVQQIKLLCDQPFTKESKIRIMPDVHTGVGCVIGFTADLGNMVIPNIVGVDIGCGMLTVELGKCEIDYPEFDKIVNSRIPSGKNVHEGRKVRLAQLQELYCYRNLKQTKWIERSIGTLGGGNHFIEADEDEEGNKYLVIHTGSRNLGKQVAELYQDMAYDIMRGKDKFFEERERIIKEYKEAGRRKEIQAVLKKLKAEFKDTDVPRELCYLTGKYRDMYIHDMKMCQEFAVLNRRTIADTICSEYFGKGIDEFEHFETVHNYIDHESNIIRKGAVSARKGEKLLIPINMRDGSLICMGKGNPEWNYSAPHGAGRLFSRREAKEKITLEEYRDSMKGIYTSCVNSATIDESPMAYKDMKDIIGNIEPTAEIIKTIKPVYNFKASD